MVLSNPPEDLRPPGGTSRTPGTRTPGTRTPRKVQWLDDRSEGSAGTPLPAEDGAAHVLDEQGLDTEGYTQLIDALERHRRATPLSKIHYYPPQPTLSPYSDDERRELTDANGRSEELGRQKHSDGIYSSSSYDSGASSRIFWSSSSLARTPSPTHDVPENFIDEDEDSGLPGTKDLRKFSKRRAQNVVRSHLRQGSFWPLNRRDPGPGRRMPPSDQTRRYSRKFNSSSGAGRSDIEDGAGTRPFQGGGILSTLLNLYNTPEDAPSEQSSRRSSPDGESTPDTYWSGDEHETGRQTPRRFLPDFIRAQGREGHGEKFHVHKHSLKTKLPSVLNTVPRPAAARNAGGVFGPLIASTGNLAGVAAPASSQLQPNTKRPGYHLSRYSLESKPKLERPRPTMRRLSSFITETQRQSPSDNMTPPTTPISPGPMYQGGMRSNFSGIFGSYASSIRSSGRRSGSSTPRSPGPQSEHDQWLDRKDNVAIPGQERKRHKRKKAEVYITRHVAQIVRREEFLMKLTRAMMMFGGPSHRLQAQILSAARVLDIELSFMYLPDVVLLSFDDSGTGTSHIKLIRQTSALNLGKLNDAFALYWKVIHDKLSVSDASVQLDELMRKRPMYNWWQLIFIGGMCSAAICTVSFGGSFIDSLVSFPLGALLVAIQLLSVRNTLYSYVFEVTVTTLFSFIAAALATTNKLCYSAIASSSVVLILPGFLVLTGSLELLSRNIVAGSVRLCYAVVYALFLGFGFSIGAELFETFTSRAVTGPEDYACTMSHNPSGPWYQRTPSKLWAFLTVPLFSLFLSLRNQAPWNQKEIVLLVAIACVGWVTNHFTGTRFVDQGDISAGVGAFAVGFVANLYARIFGGNAFVIMITGILFQLPSGLGSGGLLSYATQQASGSPDSYISGFRTALKLVSVAIGLTVGLGLSLSVTHPIQSRKREAGIFSL
ncbi:hypothetical protein B0H34DRAFT_664487 [Crassisporium funariophilum]|nr:hypothetical protein B0H34DRAFT_664487 [Crassisporium funariophilum]